MLEFSSVLSDFYWGSAARSVKFCSSSLLHRRFAEPFAFILRRFFSSHSTDKLRGRSRDDPYMSPPVGGSWLVDLLRS